MTSGERIPRASLRSFLQSLAALSVVALLGCNDVDPPAAPTSASVHGDSVISSARQMDIPQVIAAVNDPSRSDGSILVSLKEPGARSGVDPDGRPIAVLARYAAEAALRRAFPELAILDGVARPVPVAHRRGTHVDTIHRTFVRIAGPFSSQTLLQLRQNPHVDFFEPNWRTASPARGRAVPFLHVAPSSAAPSVHAGLLHHGGDTIPWGMDSVRATDAWRLGYAGRGVHIKIVDSGIDIHDRVMAPNNIDFAGGHPDIYADTNIYQANTTWGETTPSGTYLDNRCTVAYSPCWHEDDAHGTGVLGALNAIENDTGSIGAAHGRAPWIVSANVVYVRTDGSPWMFEADMIDGVNFVSNYPGTTGRRIGITSVELEGDDTVQYRALRNAFRSSAALGILWFSAVEEDGTNTVGAPGSFDEAIAVGSLRQNLTRRAQSPVNPSVEFTAPGEALRISWNRRFQQDAVPFTEVATGSSFAAPIAAGVARLAWEVFPQWTAATLRAELRQHARDLGAAGRDNEYGYGMPDAICIINQVLPCVR